MQEVDEEEEKLLKEGEALDAMMENIISEPGGYNPNDYVTVKTELPNCIHEYVAPSDFQRADYKKPAKRAKEYKFTLDKF